VALGARPAHVVRLIAGEGLTLAAVGLAAGSVGIFIIGRFLEAYLFGIAPADLSVFSSAMAVLLVATALALVVPLRRALGVNIVESLKTE
jgi:ABC-type antimicrobial peptide transport system permease subunit